MICHAYSLPGQISDKSRKQRCISPVRLGASKLLNGLLNAGFIRLFPPDFPDHCYLGYTFVPENLMDTGYVMQVNIVDAAGSA